MKKNRLFIISFLVVASTAVFLIPTKSALQEGSGEYFETLIAGRNVNMVSGTTLPGGDPYLQRQNEPSLAVSSRNPLHLLAGANDYRTVDMPIAGEELPGIEESMAADAWLGYYTSYDGGESWKSYLLPGFPQDLGSTSPLKNYSTATDPWVCAGSKGRFYYSGLVFNRGGKESAVFVARFEDTNDKEGGNTIEYRGVTIVATGNAGQFVDMPRMAVDVPRGASNDYIFLVYTVFVGNLDQNIKSKMYCTRSTDGGLTWSSPTKLSESQHIIQGASLAVDPMNGDVYVAFRRFYHKSQENGIVVVKSTDRGQSFSHPLEIATFPNDPFDQPATPNEVLYPDPNDYVPGESFRTNSYPAIAVDNNHRVYVAWSQRNYNPGGEARIIMKTSLDGSSWSSPILIDPGTHQGHQFMPQLVFGAGKLTLVWYDQRSDWFAQEYGFGQWISDWMQNIEGDLMRRTIDIWAAQVDADYYSDPSQWSYTQVSRYLYALLVDSSGNIQYYGDSPIIFPVQFNCPNYPLFKGGMLPFIGDYIAVVSSPTIILQNGQWVFNTQDSDNPVFHVAWTDNRDVRPPVGSWDWTDYTPANSTQSSEFISSGRTDCTTGGNSPAIRNQNIYTSKLSWGLVAGSPTNEKSLDLSVPRAFVIFVQNNTEVFRRLRLTITQEPPGGDASFLQFDSLDQIIVTIAPFSTISRQVFIQSTNPSDSARVDIVEIDANGNDISGGLTGYVILNKDPSSDGVSGSEEYHQPGITNPNIVNWVVNPNIVNPNIVNPNIVNPNIVNPNIVNPNIVNDPLNPNIVNPNIVNPNIVNPNIVNPNIVNPNIVNPNIVNPNIVNPNIVNAGEPGNVDGVPVSDVMWTVKNEGNSATSYTLKTVAKKTPPDGVYAQLLVYRVHKTPAVAGEELSTTYGYDGCALYEEPHHELVLNVANPNIVNPNIVNIGAVNPNIVNPNIVNESILNATFSLGAGEEAIVDLRVLDTKYGERTQSQTLAATQNKFSIQAFDINEFISSIGFVVTSMSVDSDDAAAGIKIPKGTATDLYIASSNPPDGVVGDYYESYLTAFGGAAPYNYTWSLNSGELPPGLSITTGPLPDTNVEGAYGIISGTPTTAGTYDFMVQVTDDPDYMDTQLYSITIHEGSIPDTPTITTTSLPGGVKDTWYGATIHVSGGDPPYSFSWSDGTTSPPEADGLYLDPGNGIISGTPTEAATYNFKVKVTDYDGEYAEQTYDLVILASPANYWKISGTVYDENTGDPLEGVLLHGLPNTPTTDTYGNYEDDVPEGWEGTVTPFKLDHTFDPEQRTYTSADTVADLPGQDYNFPTAPALPTKIELTGPQKIGGGFISEALTITAQDETGTPIPVAQDTVFNLSSDSSGISRFFSDPDGNTPINQVTIPTGQTSVTFYYMDHTPGNPTVTATWASGGSDLSFDTHQPEIWAVVGQIAFTSDRDGDEEIFIMNADGTGQTQLTYNSDPDAYPCWSPQGSRIAFQSYRDGNNEIYIMNSDGSKQVRLTDNQATDVFPKWSPDGRKIAFVSNRDGNLEIYVMNADGSSPVNLTNHPAFDSHPSWSPDGTKISFMSTRDGDSEIFVMDADGSNQTQLTFNTIGNSYPSWSPDGSKIAYSNDSGTNCEIFVMDADGSNQTQLTDNSAFDSIPSWSPDGSRIVFLSYRDGHDQIYTMNADGSNQINITDTLTNESFPSWGGAKIAFTSLRDGNREIYIMNADGTGQTRLTANSAEDTELQWSRSGEKVVFTSLRDGNAEIYMMNADGQGQINLTNNSATDSWPVLSPDGTKIAFQSNRDGNWEIYVMNADGSGLLRLTNDSAQDALPCWSPDGTKLLYSTQPEGSSDCEIYVMNADGSGSINLTNYSSYDNWGVWSPDGNKILFRTDRNAEWDIYIMNADGSGQTNLTPASGNNYNPLWSPDGTKIVFQSYRDGNHEVYVMNADGSGQTRLTFDPAQDVWPSWSPNGRKIVFMSIRDGNNEIYIMNPDGTEKENLTRNPAHDQNAVWRWLLFKHYL